jgi:hypothetical protein
MNQQSFLEYCRPLRGLIVYKNGVEKAKYLLYWYKINVKDILENKKGFSTKERV